MRPSTAITAAINRPNYRLIAIGMSGCMLALIVGVLAATRYDVLVGTAIIGLAFLGIVIATYVKDPVLAIIGLWLFEVFTAPLSATFGYYSSTGQVVRQGDELLVLLFVCLTIRRTLRTSVKMPALRFILPGVGVALFGILGAIVHGVPLNVTMTGALLGLKFWIMIVVTLLLPWKQTDLARVYRVFTRVGLVIAGLGLADYFTHGAVSRALHTSNYNVGGVSGYRSDAVHSIFPSPGEYSLFMSLLFALVFSRFTHRYSKSDLILALIFAGSVMLSLQLKGFLSLAAVVAIVGLVQGAANSRRAMTALLVGLLLAAAAYGAEGSVIAKQFSIYASSETSARSRLYSTGEQIAADNFPLGVGFGRFASYPSRLYYSPVYYQYKLSRVWGLSPTYPNFIDDTSWPSVIGETGYGGLAAYAIGLIVLVLVTIRRLRTATFDMAWVPLAALCAIAVLIVDSLGEASLFSWLAAATVAMIFGPMLIATQSASDSMAMSPWRSLVGERPI